MRNWLAFDPFDVPIRHDHESERFISNFSKTSINDQFWLKMWLIPSILSFDRFVTFILSPPIFSIIKSSTKRPRAFAHDTTTPGATCRAVKIRSRESERGLTNRANLSCSCIDDSSTLTPFTSLSVRFLHPRLNMHHALEFQSAIQNFWFP